MSSSAAPLGAVLDWGCWDEELWRLVHCSQPHQTAVSYESHLCDVCYVELCVGKSGDDGSVGSNGGSEYLVQLCALNVGVSKWISSHVEKNPHVDLTPIFRDYEKHLKMIDRKVCVLCTL